MSNYIQLIILIILIIILIYILEDSIFYFLFFVFFVGVIKNSKDICILEKIEKYNDRLGLNDGQIKPYISIYTDKKI